MKSKFNVKHFLQSIAGYFVVLVFLNATFSRHFAISEPLESMIEIFLAVITVRIIEQLYRRYKHKA
jgi:Fe2+ transport system protein B